MFLKDQRTNSKDYDDEVKEPTYDDKDQKHCFCGYPIANWMYCCKVCYRNEYS